MKESRSWVAGSCIRLVYDENQMAAYRWQGHPVAEFKDGLGSAANERTIIAEPGEAP